MRNAH